ncbi:MAG TPA: hypothetical protein DIT42_04985 [Gammaproteobacteria bacterium]|nr:hypothetical protein [Gammaproteobacteria bacterium]
MRYRHRRSSAICFKSKHVSPCALSSARSSLEIEAFMNKEDFRQATRTQLDAIDSEINTHGAQRQLALQNAAFRRRVENYVGVGAAPQNSAADLPRSNAAKESLLEDAVALEALFAVEHPVAEKLLRELINSLSRLGI